MNLRKLLMFVVFVSIATHLYAQWTKEDSIWMEDVKSGKTKIELNQETLKAIEEGRLIGTDRPNNQLRESSSQYSITKEFTGIQSVPSSIFILREIPDSGCRKSFVYVAPPKDYISMKRIPIGTGGLYLTAVTGDLNSIVKDGQSKGGALAGIAYSFSMEDLLRYVFWSSERAKRKNRKNATAWKYY
ncbi:MAG: hypothetical protein PHF73_06035 [Massilibacteroides sp.]|nr:hypothetical protein [Massilibacteroides sp.]